VALEDEVDEVEERDPVRGVVEESLHMSPRPILAEPWGACKRAEGHQNPRTRNCHRPFARSAHTPTRTHTLTPNGAIGEDRHAMGKGTGMGKG